MVVETALTAGLGLVILLFAIKVGIIAFLQVTADAAAFTDAHAHSVGTLDPLGAEHAKTALFPQVQASDISASPAPAPSVSFPLNYGFNAGGATLLHAGVALLEPQLFTTTVTPHGKETLLGKILGVSGQDIEPKWVECGPHYNIAQSNSQCGATGQPSSFAVDYFATGENTPPYYVGFNFRSRCTLPQPWTQCQGIAADYTFMALGVGEFLDVANWNAASAGASGTGVSGTQPLSTFEYMACHQRVYSNLIGFLNTYPTLQTIYTAYSAAIAAQVKGTAGSISDYRNWNEFTTSPGTVSTADSYVREIYNWDATVARAAALNPSGEPGATPLHPGLGC